MATTGGDTSMQDVHERKDTTFVVHCLVRTRQGKSHDTKIFKSEARADEWVKDRIRHYNMNPDPDPETGHEECCDYDPSCVAWASHGFTLDQIWKLPV
jgi:hypothetical protein